jgi:mannose-6-phosphate isomerase-like protein (cupin superfamily)
MKRLLVFALLTPLFAADPSGFKLWKAQDLKSFTKSEMLSDFGNHNTRMTVRDKDGDVEIHRDWTDVMVVESGEATIAIGGTAVNPKETSPGESRAESVKGAEKHTIGPGDIFHIPAGVPHQFLVAPGKKIVYFALKVPAK